MSRSKWQADYKKGDSSYKLKYKPERKKREKAKLEHWKNVLNYNHEYAIGKGPNQFKYPHPEFMDEMTAFGESHGLDITKDKKRNAYLYAQELTPWSQNYEGEPNRKVSKYEERIKKHKAHDRPTVKANLRKPMKRAGVSRAKNKLKPLAVKSKNSKKVVKIHSHKEEVQQAAAEGYEPGGAKYMKAREHFYSLV